MSLLILVVYFEDVCSSDLKILLYPLVSGEKSGYLGVRSILHISLFGFILGIFCNKILFSNRGEDYA